MKLISVLTLLSLIFTVINCANNTSIEKESDIIWPNFHGASNDSFPQYIDTTINKIIILWNSASTYDVFGNLRGKHQESEDEGEIVLFKNTKGDKYLKTVHLPGSDPNTFRLFEVGFVRNLKEKYKLLPSNLDEFETESKIRLGISTDTLLKIKNLNFNKIVSGRKVIFQYSEVLDLLTYRIRYEFEDGILINFSFGYDNP